ncbi:MAG: 2-oxoacid:acceptor oxidoreductase family protein [Candidatus Diapherotrites archaeon]|uniref:pyruvate synthase n=1 Tax=Candidatus Iainarchaeum sp. TaxID=3101447 RepID=A0A7J4IWC1_9ARCH|nr:MAG: pyruvate/ketoisovalerate ferredoxin oxidoreductase subunit gamma [archaeon GW2011_AR10]MBS3059789.1 2-oxoacid:acceptor oxidoreductase family protein [Candidatus Diapherotrites archaeon]HIH08555.1 pyruvate ferredoxin oxidoreductase [Candidatus Diapherotrites archaeon]
MKEIRFHGRAGQGMVTAAVIVANAVSLEGKYSQAFPFFGSEKRGPPVTSYCRIDDKPINIHEEIDRPDIVVVADASTLKEVDVCAGLKENGIVIINTNRKPEQLKLKAKRVFTIDGTGIALKHLGKPITNTVMLGALLKVTGIAKLENALKALEKQFGSKLSKEMVEKNKKVVVECYDLVQLQEARAK